MPAECNIKTVLQVKAKKFQLSKEQIECFVNGCVHNTIQQCQIGAMLMAIYLNGLNEDETVYLTEALINSGEILKWKPEWETFLVGKHSTGGVGDKVSIPLIPALAACGLKVPTLSGKGLGLTGGTLDKLSSIPGFNIRCDYETLLECLEKASCFISGTNETICPGDRILYDIRDVTGTVNNFGLMIASILSKKYVEGVKNIVIDVKIGNGGCFNTIEESTEFTNILKNIAKRLGLNVIVVLSKMNSPTGHAVGNALEIQESLDCLHGNGPRDLYRMVTVLGANLLYLSRKVNDIQEGEEMISASLKNGTALHHFYVMLTCQGVTEETATELCYNSNCNILPAAKCRTRFKTKRAGYIEEINAYLISKVCLDLGAGRIQTTDKINYATGIKLLHNVGDRVEYQDDWVEVHHDGNLTQDLCNDINNAILLTDNPLGNSNDIVIGIA